MSETGTVLKKLADATDPLYRSLDDAQRRRFVMLSRMMGPPGPQFRGGDRKQPDPTIAASAAPTSFPASSFPAMPAGMLPGSPRSAAARRPASLRLNCDARHRPQGRGCGCFGRD